MLTQVLLESAPRARRSQILVEEVPHGVILFDLPRGRAHYLNGAAATLWKACDGETSIRDLERLLAAELGDEGVADAVLLGLKRLDAARLLADPGGTRGQLTRRALLGRLARVGVAAALLPAVASVITATPAYAANSTGVFFLRIFVRNRTATNNTITATVLGPSGQFCTFSLRNNVTGTCSITYLQNHSVNITALGSVAFTSWGPGLCSGTSAVCTLTWPSGNASSVRATFT